VCKRERKEEAFLVFRLTTLCAAERGEDDSEF